MRCECVCVCGYNNDNSEVCYVKRDNKRQVIFETKHIEKSRWVFRRAIFIDGYNQENFREKFF